MRVLLTNDDGIDAGGIYALYREIRKIAEVSIVAPHTQQSAVGHAITIFSPLRVTEIFRKGKFYGYAVNGTPADCVKIAVRALLKKRPDIVISGINLGPNLGTDVMYSGTVSAATEAAILGIPSLAVSLTTYGKSDFAYAAGFTRRLCALVKKHGLPPDTLLNVNIPAVPAKKIRGIAVTRQGKSRYLENFDRRVDPRGKTYYWLSGERIKQEEDDNEDIQAVRKNLVSITPLGLNLTRDDFLRELKNLLERGRF